MSSIVYNYSMFVHCVLFVSSFVVSCARYDRLTIAVGKGVMLLLSQVPN